MSDGPLAQEEIARMATELRLVPDTILCSETVQLSLAVYKSGRTGDAGTDYLRWTDLNIDKEGRVEGDDIKARSIKKGQGISFFIKKALPGSMIHIESGKLSKSKKKQLKALYENVKQANWWKLDKGMHLPAGLLVVYDGDPPGHCTLSPDREMSVEGFLALVAQITFIASGNDILGIQE